MSYPTRITTTTEKERDLERIEWRHVSPNGDFVDFVRRWSPAHNVAESEREAYNPVNTSRLDEGVTTRPLYMSQL